MEWSRVKSIMIGVFCIINIFLLISYMGTIRTSVNISEEAISNTAAILENNNVFINVGIIPRKTQDIRTFNVKNKYASPQEAAQSFWNTAQKEGLGCFNPQNVYTDSKSFVYTASPQEKIEGLNKKNAVSYVKKLISKLGLADAESLECVVEESDGKYTVAFYQMFDNSRVLDKRLVFILDQYGISEIRGENWLCDEIEGGGLSSIHPITEILVNFAVSADRATAVEITDIQLGYFIGSRDTIKITEAVPVWRITTDSGDNFYYDARNGDLL